MSFQWFIRLYLMLTFRIPSVNADIKKSGSNHLFFFKSTEFDFACNEQTHSQRH